MHLKDFFLKFDFGKYNSYAVTKNDQTELKANFHLLSTFDDCQKLFDQEFVQFIFSYVNCDIAFTNCSRNNVLERFSISTITKNPELHFSPKFRGTLYNDLSEADTIYKKNFFIKNMDILLKVEDITPEKFLMLRH